MGDTAARVADPGGLFHNKHGDGPSTPDFTSAVEAQSKSSRPNQTNAFGASSTWGTGPDGRPTQTGSIGGPLGDASQELQGQFASANATPLDNGAQARQHAEDAIYGRETSRLDPMWQKREQDTRAQLAAQGLDPGSEAGGKELDILNRGRNDAYTSALQSAIMGGGQEASRQQGMDITARGAPLQGLMGIHGLTQQGPTGGAAQYLPAALAQYQGDLQKYGIKEQGKNSTMAGMSNLGGSALGYAAMA